LAKLETDKTDVQQKLLKSQLKIDSLKKALERNVLENGDAESEIMKYSKEIEQYKAQLGELNLQYKVSQKKVDSINSSSQKKESKIKEYKVLLSAQKENVSLLSQRKDELETELKNIKSNLEKEEFSAINSASQLNSLEDQHKQTKKELLNANLKIDSLKTSSDIKTNRFKSLQEENKNLRKKANTLLSKQQNYTESIDSLKNEIVFQKHLIKSYKESDTLSSKADNIGQENVLQKQKIESLNRKLAEQQRKLEILEVEKQKTSNSLDSLELVSQKNKNQAVEYKSLLDEHIKETIEITELKNQLEVEIENIKKVNYQNQLQEENKGTKIVALEKEKKEINNKLIKTGLSIDSLNKAVQIQQNQLKALQTENELQQQQLATAEKSNTTQQTDIVQKSDFDELQMQLKDAMISNDSLSLILKSKNRAISNLKSGSTLQTRELNSLEIQNDSLINQLYHFRQVNDSLDNLIAQKIVSSALNETVEEDTIENDVQIEETGDDIDYYPMNSSRTKVKLKNKKFVESYFESYIEKYLSRKTSLEFFELNEYFFFYVDTTGSIVRIEDQRTEFNNNTKLLKDKDLNSIKGVKFKPVIISNTKKHVKVAVGIQINVHQTKYDYRVQKDKIRVYKTPLYVEYVEPGDKHYLMVSDTLKGYLTVTDRFNITIIDGSYSLTEYARKEYNPFSHEKSTFFTKDILKITKLRGIK